METSQVKKRKVYVHQIQSGSWKNFLPLSAGLLVSYAESIPEIYKEYDFDIKILREKPSQTVASYENPDVLAFSTYSWNFKQSLEIARLGKAAFPDCLIVFGGPMMPGNFDNIRVFLESHRFIDIIVRGMGEWPFAEILLARINKKEFSYIAGASYARKNGFVVANNPFYDRDLNEIPSPFLNGIFDEILLKYKDKISGALWETNRGCPYNCAYCVQGNIRFPKIINFDEGRLAEEMEWISKNKMYYVFGADANFGLFHRDIKIAEMIAEFGKQNGFPKFFIINWLKFSSKKMMDIIETVRKGGVHTQLTLSMQSFNNDTLLAIKRRNMDLSSFEELKKEANKKGIITYTELILGLPNETCGSLLSAMDKCMDRYQNHFFIVYLCRLLDGAEMSEPDYKNKYKIETRTCRIGLTRHEWMDAGVDENEEIVVATSTLPVKDWEKMFVFINVVLALHNFRLSFFIFNYLKAEYSINLIDLISYIIDKRELYPVIGKALGIINNGSQSILSGQTYLASLDFMGNMLFETHEAALLSILSEKDIFYSELRILVDNYLKSNEIIVQQPVLGEVFKYQAFRIPTWQKSDYSPISFDFNIPQYFQALCIDDEPIAIRPEKISVKIDEEEIMRDNPIDFAKSRLTISKLEILKIIQL